MHKTRAALSRLCPSGCHLGHDEVTRVALQFFVVQVHVPETRSSSIMLRFMASLYLSTESWSCSRDRRSSQTEPGLGRSAWPEQHRTDNPRYLSYSVTFTGVPTGAFSKNLLAILSRQTNATVRRGKGRHIALMHRVAASEKHGIRHLRTVEMRPCGTPILSSVNV